MPLPLFLLGAAAVAGLSGVTGVSGAKKIKDAKGIVRDAEQVYNEKKTVFDKVQGQAEEILDELGMVKLEIWKGFERFSKVFEIIKNKPDFGKQEDVNFRLDDAEVKEIKQISIHAVELLGGYAAVSGAGALANLAVSGGVMSAVTIPLASASAVTAFGGGSLLLGGVISGAAALPALGVGGLLLNAKGNKSIQKAVDTKQEIKEAIELMERSERYLKSLTKLCGSIQEELRRLQDVYEKQISKLEHIVAERHDYEEFTEDDLIILSNNIMLVKVLKELTNEKLVTERKGEMSVRKITLNRKIEAGQKATEHMVA